MKDPESFFKVEHKGKGGKRGLRTRKVARQQVNQNMFQVLETDDDPTDTNKAKEGSPMEEGKEGESEQI